MRATIGFQEGFTLPGSTTTGGGVVINGEGYQYGDSDGVYYGFFTDTGDWLIKHIDVIGMTVTRTYALSVDYPAITTYADAWTQRGTLSYA